MHLPIPLYAQSWLERAVAKDDNRPIMTFVHSIIRSKKPGTWWVAADGYRMHIMRESTTHYADHHGRIHPTQHTPDGAFDPEKYPEFRTIYRRGKAIESCVKVDVNSMLLKAIDLRYALEKVTVFQEHVWIVLLPARDKLALCFDTGSEIYIVETRAEEITGTLAPVYVSLTYLIDALSMPAETGELRAGVTDRGKPLIFIKGDRNPDNDQYWALVSPMSPGYTGNEKSDTETLEEAVQMAIDAARVVRADA